MHAKKSTRRIRLGLTTIALTTLIGLSLTGLSEAASTNPVPVCVDGVCTLTFDYTGSYYQWTPPAGISQLSFDIFGGEGGRSGGKGGEVSGSFSAIPSTLFIYVGGAGSVGNAAAGGFNGGGAAGSGHADAGSGGGATDLRIANTLADRVVVAGGGGGFGGWIGAAGAAGGLLTAGTGTKGGANTGGGGGGSQTAGGVAGLGSTSPGNGFAGSLGLGGAGGTFTIAGGGGGGGGYYGGGGGGGDAVSGGSDGAGGGGGSSYAAVNLTTSIQHLAGVRTGNGQVILRYSHAPSVTSFAPQGTSSTNQMAMYRLAFNDYTLGLSSSDFTLTGTAQGCSVTSIYGDGYVYQVTVSGCGIGTLNLTLRSDSVTSGNLPGPVSDVSSSELVTFDNQAPTIRFSGPGSLTNASTLNFAVSSDEAFNQPQPSAFSLLGSGCSLGLITMNSAKTATVSVNSCADGANVSLRLDLSAVSDLAGNVGIGFVSVNDIQVDRTAPSVTSVSSTSGNQNLVQFAIGFSEPVTGLTQDALSLTGTGCSISKLEGAQADYLVWVTGCLESATLVVKSLRVSDAAGNLGPTTDASTDSGSLDRQAPIASLTEVTRSSKAASPSFEIHFDETVTGLSVNSFTYAGTVKGCGFTLVTVIEGRSYRLDTTGCSAGTLQVKLPSLSVTDLAGNAGPLVAVVSALANIDLVPVSVPLHSSGETIHAGVVGQVSFQGKSTKTKTTQGKTPEITPQLIANKTKAPENIQPVDQLTAQAQDWIPVFIALLAIAVTGRRRGGRRATRK